MIDCYFTAISTVSPPSTETSSTDMESEANETSKSSNQLYVTLGAALGGLALLLMLCLGIYFCNKHRHTAPGSQGLYLNSFPFITAGILFSRLKDG